MSLPPRSARDALTQELLGSLLELQERIDQLPSSLDERIAATTTRLEEVTTRIRSASDDLIKAGNHHQLAITEYLEKVVLPRINSAAEAAVRATDQAAGDVQHQPPSPIPAASVRDEASPSANEKTSIVWPVTFAATLGFLAGLAVFQTINLLIKL